MTDEVPLTQLPKYHNVTLIGADFAAEFFADTGMVELNLVVLNDHWRDLAALCAENDWSIEDGLRIILANGLAYLRRRSDEGSLEAKQAYLDLSAQFAVMKFRTFQFMQAAQTLDLKLSAARSELNILRQANERLRVELERCNGRA